MDYLLRIHIYLPLVLGLLFAPGPVFGEEAETPAVAAPEVQKASNFEEAFKRGIELYQNKKFADASAQFRQAVDFQPLNVSGLTNLALSEFEAGHKPIAVALLRKALAIDPDFSTPEAALKFILPQLEVREIPHEIQFRETLRAQFLSPVPWPAYLLLNLMCLVAGGWLVIGYLGGRRRAIKSELPLPPFPSVGVIFIVGFLVTTFLSAAKFLDYQIPRGTIIADKITVMSAPDQKAVSLFDLYGGHEVIIEKLDTSSKEEWVQVTYPGALSGWIPKSSIYPTSGKGLW